MNTATQEVVKQEGKYLRLPCSSISLSGINIAHSHPLTKPPSSISHSLPLITFPRPQNTTQTGGWNELWRRDIHPWDKGVPSPALIEVIEQKPISAQIPKSGNVLVPGCGRGVDVFYLGNEHRKAYGLDISPIAVQQCKDVSWRK